MTYLRTEKLIYIFSIVMFLALSLLTNYSNHQQTFERQELCRQQAKEDNLSVEICTQVSQMVEGSLSNIQDTMMPFVILLFGFILAPQLRVKQLEKDVKELQEKLNV